MAVVAHIKTLIGGKSPEDKRQQDKNFQRFWYSHSLLSRHTGVSKTFKKNTQKKLQN